MNGNGIAIENLYNGSRILRQSNGYLLSSFYISNILLAAWEDMKFFSLKNIKVLLEGEKNFKACHVCINLTHMCIIT